MCLRQNSAPVTSYRSVAPNAKLACGNPCITSSDLRSNIGWRVCTSATVGLRERAMAQKKRANQGAAAPPKRLKVSLEDKVMITHDPRKIVPQNKKLFTGMQCRSSNSSNSSSHHAKSENHATQTNQTSHVTKSNLKLMQQKTIQTAQTT